MALTSEGLIVKRQPEVLSDLVSKDQQYIHPDINTSDDEFLGQSNRVLAETVSSLLNLMEAVNDNFNIDSAEGVNLDKLGAIRGVPRNIATKSQGSQDFTGDPLTVVPEASIVEIQSTGDRFATSAAFTLTTSSCSMCIIDITAEDSATYTLGVSGTNYTITSDASATVLEIITALVAEVDGDSNSVVEAIPYNSNTQIQLNGIDKELFSITTTSNMSVYKVTSRGYALASVTGPTQASEGVVSRLITPVVGVDSTTNPFDYTVGRDRELDEDYRLRIKTDQASNAKATNPAIKAALRAITGVTYATAISNNTEVTDGDGRPSKSVECIVQGATDIEVATAIHNVIADGIRPYGTTTIAILDEDGDSHEISFSRPSAVNIAIDIEYTTYPEEMFPDGGETTMVQAALDYVNGLGIDIDVIPKRIAGVLYDTVDGLDDVTVKVQKVGVGSLQTDRLEIADREYATAALVNATIAEV